MVLVEFMRGRKKSQVSVSFIIMMSIGTGHIMMSIGTGHYSYLFCNRNSCVSCRSPRSELIVCLLFWGYIIIM